MHQSDTATSPGAVVKHLADWIASALSMAAAIGWVNLVVGLLSAAWIATQLYRFWRFEVYALARNHRLASGTPSPQDQDLP